MMFVRIEFHAANTSSDSLRPPQCQHTPFAVAGDIDRSLTAHSQAAREIHWTTGEARGIANGKIGGEDLLLPAGKGHGTEFLRAGVNDEEGILPQSDPFGFGETINN